MINKKLISQLKEIAVKAGYIALDLREQGLIISKKEDNSPVTNADLEVSNFIYYNLARLTPNIPIICEEQPLKNLKINETFWLVDPIDGTRSYIKNMDSFTINIALIEKQKPILGFIHHPVCNKLYFTNCEGNFCIEHNGNDFISTIHRSSDHYIAVVSSRNFNETTENYIKNNKFSEIIAIPSSIKLCMIAENTADVYPKFGPTMEWDTAAGHAIVNASGGTLIDKTTNKPMNYCKANFQNEHFLAFSNRWKE